MDHLRDVEKWPIEAGKSGYSLREPSLAETRITAPQEVAADRVQVRFRLSELVEVKTWVLGFGGAARVIAPDELREMVREEVVVMMRNCEGGGTV